MEDYTSKLYCTTNSAVPSDGVWSFADILDALQIAANTHTRALQLDHASLIKMNCLLMIVRTTVKLTRLPKGTLSVKTWVRKPTLAFCYRDFDLYDDDELIGTSVMTVVFVDYVQRRAVNLKTIPSLWENEVPTPERKECLKRIALPDDLETKTSWVVAENEIDANGHLNNTMYIRHAQEFSPDDATCLDVIYNRECFCGEEITMEADSSGFVRGIKPDDEESFRVHFYRYND